MLASRKEFDSTVNYWMVVYKREYISYVSVVSTRMGRERNKRASMMEPGIWVVKALVDLMHGVRLEPVTETVDLRTTISACIAYT